MTKQLLGLGVLACTASLPLVGCQTQHSYAYVKRERWPTAQHVNQHAGGEIVRQIQEHGGVGTGASNVFGGRP